MTKSRGKYPEHTGYAHVIGLMYKLYTSSKDNTDLLQGDDEDNERFELERDLLLWKKTISVMLSNKKLPFMDNDMY